MLRLALLLMGGMAALFLPTACGGPGPTPNIPIGPAATEPVPATPAEPAPMNTSPADGHTRPCAHEHANPTLRYSRCQRHGDPASSYRPPYGNGASPNPHAPGKRPGGRGNHPPDCLWTTG